ncbi:MAG: hypothetical protein AAB036_06205 [Elusimicrobiota bacterium]
MRRLAWAAALAALSACSASRMGDGPPGASPPPPQEVAEVKDPNFELLVLETVPNADDDGVSFTKIFVDGQEIGKTPVGPRSQEKRARLKLPAGNVPMRLEHWLLPAAGEWTRLGDARQPRERFVRIENGVMNQLTLRFGADGAPSLQMSRAAFP